jgi:predicted pyridoxine 5'-phosphate oxidase superfamily flavin-nucleotide-binding protein
MINIKDILKEFQGSTIAVSTVKADAPHTIFILYPKVALGKIIITDNYMKTTVENIKNNQKICLAFFEGEKGFRINGKAKYYDSGKWLEFVKKLPENKGMPAKGAVVIEIEEIKELG